MDNEPKSSLFADIWAHIKKEWHHLKAAPLAFLCLLLAGGWGGWLVKSELWSAASEAERLHVQDLESRLAGKQADNERLIKDNERLDRKLSEASIPRGESGIPLKKRVQILADQLEEFSNQIASNSTGGFSAYIARFERRVEAARAQLDEAGLHTDELDVAVLNGSWPDHPETKTRMMATELRKLAEKVTEDVR